MSLPYFVMPLWLAPAYVKLLEFVVAIGGMVLFSAGSACPPPAGLLAGVVFAGSGSMIMWTNWPHTRVTALIPVLFWALERVIQQLRARDVVLVALVVASMLLGGFPAIVLFSHTVAAAYVLVRVAAALPYASAAGGTGRFGRGRRRGPGRRLSAIQILPFAANPGAFDLASREERGHHLPLYSAFTMIDPYAIGSCVGGVRNRTGEPHRGSGLPRRSGCRTGVRGARPA